MKKLTILVTSLQAVGHVNACAGALSGLLKRGHRVIFVLCEAFKGKLAPRGYEEYIMPLSEIERRLIETIGPNAGAIMAHLLWNAQVIGPYSPKEKAINHVRLYKSAEVLEFKNAFDKSVKQAIALFKPDLIYVDGERLPAVLHSDIPWILNISQHPSGFILDENLPPPASGFPTDGDRSEWAEWSQLRLKNFECKEVNDLFEKNGYPRFPNDRYPETQLFTVYCVPEEMNCPEFRNQKSWFNIEVFNKSGRSSNIAFESIVPKNFMDNDFGGHFSGKWIYVSMGSMCAADVGLMKRLVAALAPTNHKYIVSTGPKEKQYSLAPNMWGQEYLPQCAILPHVDLVISHAGNNTVTEVFAEGKPMIALPMCSDQFDNAQRLLETGYGTRIDPYNFTETQLVDAIEKMLLDVVLQQKLRRASERIHAINKHEELALMIERKLAL